MKVYLVHNEYCDYEEGCNGSILLGIYSSMESAIDARSKFANLELKSTLKADCPAQMYTDADDNPVVIKFSTIIPGGEPAEEFTFTIEEWLVQ